MKKILVGFFALSAFVGSQALADQVILQDAGTGQEVLKIDGQIGGLAAEVFSTLEKAGLTVTRSPERTDLEGKDIEAASYGFTGNGFEATIALGSASSVSFNHGTGLSQTTIVLSGEAAGELFGDLEKAGLSSLTSVDGKTVSSTNVSCSSDELGRTFSCTLLAVDHPEWW